ncbi:MAG: hypothetical protein Q6L58_01720 [Thermostichales cyanobacterium BF3_bins_165]
MRWPWVWQHYPLKRQDVSCFGREILLPALLLVAGQLGLIYLFSEGGGYAHAFLKTTQWDSFWYLSIVKNGYQFRGFEAPDNNVAFLPGYPALVWLVSRITGLSPELSLYVTAHGMALLFWVYLLLLLRRWGIPVYGRVLTCITVAVHPMSVYLYAGYTESLFLAMLLGFFYWGSVGHLLGMAGHGLLMAATRIVGVPVAAVALLQPWLAGQSLKTAPWRRLLGVAVLTAAGAIAFLLWCQVVFQNWRLYFDLQTYFGIKPDYSKPFQLATYTIPASVWPRLFSWEQATGDANWGLSFSRIFGLPTLVALLGLSGWDALASWRRWIRGWRYRLPYHVSAWMLFYLSVSATANLQLRSLNRYCLPVHILMILMVVHMSQGIRWRHWGVEVAKVIWLLATEVSLLMHLIIVWRYVQRLWIA